MDTKQQLAAKRATAFVDGQRDGAAAYRQHVSEGVSFDDIEAARDLIEDALGFEARGWYSEGFDIGYDRAAEGV